MNKQLKYIIIGGTISTVLLDLIYAKRKKEEKEEENCMMETVDDFTKDCLTNFHYKNEKDSE